jgi:acetyl esterase
VVLSKTADATRLHPELARVASRVPRYDYANPERVRGEMRHAIALSEAAGFWHRFHEEVAWKDQLVPGSRVPVRVYERARPVDASPFANDCIVFFHGGGFLVGDLDMEHPRCLEMCRLTGRRIVSVDYRLAPEHPFPAGLDDCATALSWAMGEAQQGAEAGRVALIGYSAGGCLAAAVCLMRRDDGLPCLQALIYPVLDDRMDTPSMRACTDTPGWDSVSAALSWRQYLGPALPVSPYAAPARAERLDGLPRTYIMAAELDPLRDEALAFGTRLVRSNVPTEVHHFSGAFHGFDVLSSSKLAARAREEQYAVLRDALTP